MENYHLFKLVKSVASKGETDITTTPEYKECIVKLEDIFKNKVIKIHLPTEPIPPIRWDTILNEQLLTTFNVSSQTQLSVDVGLPIIVAFRPVTIEDFNNFNLIGQGVLTEEEEAEIFRSISVTYIHEIPLFITFAAFDYFNSIWEIYYNWFSEPCEKTYKGKVEIPIYSIDSKGNTDQATVTLEFI